MGGESSNGKKPQATSLQKTSIFQLLVGEMTSADQKEIAKHPQVKNFTAERMSELMKNTGLSCEEVAAITLYTFKGNEYQKAALADPSKMTDVIKTFDETFKTALSKLPTVKKTVYRGLTCDISEFESEAKSPTSTSVNEKVAKAFCELKDDDEDFEEKAGPMLLEYEDVDAKDISKFSLFPGEEEYIIATEANCVDTDLSVEVDDKTGAIYYKITMTQVDANGAKTTTPPEDEMAKLERELESLEEEGNAIMKEVTKSEKKFQSDVATKQQSTKATVSSAHRSAVNQGYHKPPSQNSATDLQRYLDRVSRTTPQAFDSVHKLQTDVKKFKQHRVEASNRRVEQQNRLVERRHQEVNSQRLWEQRHESGPNYRQPQINYYRQRSEVNRHWDAWSMPTGGPFFQSYQPLPSAPPAAPRVLNPSGVPQDYNAFGAWAKSEGYHLTAGGKGEGSRSHAFHHFKATGQMPSGLSKK